MWKKTGRGKCVLFILYDNPPVCSVNFIAMYYR